MTPQEKLEYEFQCFFLDQMRTSKENIFAHSREIEIKKRLAEQLRIQAGELDEETAQCLMLQNNLLESAYCFWQDVKPQDAEDLKGTVQAWISFLRCQNQRKGR